ncbi:hypothetical protein LCGC14_0749170 [marine sediment metagenome]|uniref:Uncharacterized protein n=1 Tax=marine sediment metagenome TaxID=412755 RepID=A0A0F9QPD0_9ZZZZ
MSDRTTVAQELALKDGQDWERLSEVMANAYLHNADLVIEERDRPVADAITGKTLYTCERCQDRAYIHGNPCSECNPVGLPVEQVYPEAVSEEAFKEPEKVDPRLVNLCDTCSLNIAECGAPDVEYGDGVGNDNVINCYTYSPTESTGPTAEEVAAKEAAVAKAAELELRKSTGQLGPNEYRCGKCSKPGRTVIHILQKSGKGIGHKHQEFKIVDSPAGT